MKSKNIPADIKLKSIKEAQNEIKEIIISLENKDINLEDSVDKYNRMIQLNSHIKDKFKEQLSEIKNFKHKNKTDSLNKD